MDKDILLKIELPKGWAKATISEMISADGVFVDGDWIESKDQDQNGDVRLIQLADIGDGDFRDKSSRFLTLKRAKEIGCTFLLEGDILVARMPDPIGRACLFPLKGENKFVTAVDVAIIRTGKDSINNKLLNYFINSPIIRNKIEALQSGTTRKRISRGNLSLIEFPVPPLNEQNRIVDKLDELLSELEKGKEQLQTSLEQLKVYRQSILKHAFEGKLSEEWRKKQKKLKTPDELVAEIKAYRKQQYEKQLKEYKAGKIKIKPKEPKEISLPTKSELAEKPELPKGWFYIFLKDISEVVERVNLKEKKSTESFLYLDIGGINNDKNIIESHKEYKWKDAPSRAQQIVKINDILFSTVRTYMKNIAMVDDEQFSNQVASSGFTVVRALKGIINSNFLFKQLLSDAFIQPLNDLQTGSSYPAVRDTDVFNQIVPICSIEEQIFVTQELDEKYSIVQNLEETINQNLVQSESLRQTLLQKAFEGKLVGQDPTDEPASILLERIKKEREEFLKAEKERKKTEKPLHIKSRKMAEELKRIIEILKESKEPVSAKTLWQSSTHKDDIDDFYAALKKHIESGEIIELPRKGKESFLKLSDAK